MDSSWQGNRGPNPADAADGPASYDHHLYYSYGVRPCSYSDPCVSHRVLPPVRVVLTVDCTYIFSRVVPQRTRTHTCAPSATRNSSGATPRVGNRRCGTGSGRSRRTSTRPTRSSSAGGTHRSSLTPRAGAGSCVFFCLFAASPPHVSSKT